MMPIDQCGNPSQFETHMRRLGTQRPSQNVNKSASEPQMCVPYRLCLFFASHASERPRTHLAKIQIAKKKLKKLFSLFQVTYSPSDLHGTVRLLHYILYNIQSLPFIPNGNIISMYFIHSTVLVLYIILSQLLIRNGNVILMYFIHYTVLASHMERKLFGCIFLHHTVPATYTER